jgi:hypothetical protein
MQVRRFEKCDIKIIDPFDDAKTITVSYLGETVNGVAQGVGKAKYKSRNLKDETPSFSLVGYFSNGGLCEVLLMTAFQQSAYVYKGCSLDEATGDKRNFVKFYNKLGNL